MTTNGHLTTWTGFTNEAKLSVVSWQLAVGSCAWSLARFEPAGAVAMACEVGGSPSERRSREAATLRERLDRRSGEQVGESGVRHAAESSQSVESAYCE